MFSKHLLLALSLGSVISTQQVAQDTGTYGPALETVHLYNDEFVTGMSRLLPFGATQADLLGIAVSSTGRMFSNYPPSLDAKNTKYTVAELMANNTEKPYTSAEINSPPGGSINYTTTPPVSMRSCLSKRVMLTPPKTGANYKNYLIGVQSVVIDPKDRLWILDTGRASTPGGVNVPATFGGPKLIGVNLQNDSIFQTIIFPPTVAYADSVSGLFYRVLRCDADNT